MATRCIEALNELDAISEKIFYKYSKSRLKAEIEGKVRESKSRAERNASSLQGKYTSRRSSYYSSNSSTATKHPSRYSNARVTKSASTTKTPKLHQDYHKKVKTSTFCNEKANTISSTTDALQVKDSNSNARTLSPSVFGKYTPGVPKYKAGKWFNFEDGVNQGVIDSFACDDLKEKALCYKVDMKEAKPIPKLLRHRLEVRIGRNGEVRNEDSGMKHTNPSIVDTCSKKIRPAPLSWEEQLNWENTHIMTPRITASQAKTDQGLCETHPVIFHPEVRYSQVSNTTTISNEATAAYRMYLDRRLLTSDRRNLTCSGKCITSVELEDASDDVGARKIPKEPFIRTKSQESDFDKMDMSNTIQNMEKLYRTSSVELAKKVTLEPSMEGISDNTVVDNPGNPVVEKPGNPAVEIPGNDMVENPADQDKSPVDDSTLKQEFDILKMNKKVSFKDEIDAADSFNRSASRTLDEILRGNDTANNTVKRPISRPSSSKERCQSTMVQEKQVEMPRRPFTAPPSCSPSAVSRVKVNLDVSLPLKHELMSIRVPTSEHEVLSETEETDKLENSERDQSDFDNTCDAESGENAHNMRVTFACKSAPTLRVTTKENEPIKRSQSSTSGRVKTCKYIPHRPVAMLADSSMELPSNVPPAQALLELRKNIRENLAKKNSRVTA
ncbi:hypothetical protein QZH41_000500 [Actinostola sp. cb2023]|nr:hypothetical protein QZH41_000500 [Actinostola sp. cb2023]